MEKPNMNHKAFEVAVGIGVLLLGGALALGARSIPSEAGYQGIGPNFLPCWRASDMGRSHKRL
jgi:putative tricarboxylic transport membrane protein